MEWSRRRDGCTRRVFRTREWKRSGLSIARSPVFCSTRSRAPRCSRNCSGIFAAMASAKCDIGAAIPISIGSHLPKKRGFINRCADGLMDSGTMERLSILDAQPRMKQGSYILPQRDLTLDNPARRYVLKIHDLPPLEKPREKLAALGPAALSTQELLAALLNTGTKKENVLAMSSRIIKEYGERSIMDSRNPL